VTISPVVHSLHRGELALPRVRVARQVFAVPPPVDVTAQVVSQWQRLALASAHLWARKSR